ncbi:MAG: glutamate--cysteine ligase [Pseudomonadales bacterium]|nr:glutamate--cysteine ligase [Pseudomonadales bacterium]
MRRGLEKESLRVTPQGHLAMTPHPVALGSALTHPHLTTDYSESLLELITPAMHSITQSLDFLDTLRRYTLQNMGDELLWTHSMPCFLGEDNCIPLAQYGVSPAGRMKTVYRHGLGMRYGRRMQTIAGIHYNLSFPPEFWQAWQDHLGNKQALQAFISEGYFALIRNFQRHSWLLLYLFGASPAVCSSFLRGRTHPLQEGPKHTLSLPWATSLRMSDIGYQNNLQAELDISYRDLESYVAGLDHAIRTPHPPFTRLGVRDASGDWLQLNDHILQIENEFYGLIRPKRTQHSGERPGLALQRRGVEYVELRCVDLNPFTPLGIDSHSAHFLEIFALTALISPSPDFQQHEYTLLRENQRRMVQEGRKPGLQLLDCAGEFDFLQRAEELFERMSPVAQALDQAYQTTNYGAALISHKQRLHNPDACHSAAILQSMHEHGCSFYDFALDKSREHSQYFRDRPLPFDQTEVMQQQAQSSLLAQKQLENEQKDISLESYLNAYFGNR